MVENVYEPETEGMVEEEAKPKRLQARSTDLASYYQISLEELIARAKDRYDLVMKTAKLAREINASRLRYGVPRPEKATVVALNEIHQDKNLE
ncbi:MAG: DNA-directed RNA polymerase subunit omega, partial [bacterium]|nr:DNA-directed RNA polymerase subunit omega [bacterium]